LIENVFFNLSFMFIIKHKRSKMGGSQSTISQSNSQSISNLMEQESNQECINSCVASDQLAFTAVNLTLKGSITDTVSCQISNSSCILKSSLSTTLLNSLASTQNATDVSVEGLFTLLSGLTGDKNDINQSNYQSITNQVTQTVNNICRTDPTSTTSHSMSFNGDTIDGNINLNSIAGDSKANCVLDNMSNIYANNSETNSQSATIAKIGIMGLLIIGLIVIALVIVVVIAFVFIIRPSAVVDLAKAAEE
jgi:hypothetical protein